MITPPTNCRACPSCLYTVKIINGRGRHYLHCHQNQAVEKAMGYPPVIMDQARSDGQLPYDVIPAEWCPLRFQGINLK